MAVGCTNVLGIQRCICSDNGYVKIIIDNVHYFEVFLYVHYHMSFDSAVFFLHLSFILKHLWAWLKIRGGMRNQRIDFHCVHISAKWFLKKLCLFENCTEK